MGDWEIEAFNWIPVTETKTKPSVAPAQTTLLDRAKHNVTQYNQVHHPVSPELREGILEASTQGVDYCTIPAIKLSRADEVALEKAGFRVTRMHGCEEWTVTLDGVQRIVAEVRYLISWKDSKRMYL